MIVRDITPKNDLMEMARQKGIPFFNKRTSNALRWKINRIRDNSLPSKKVKNRRNNTSLSMIHDKNLSLSSIQEKMSPKVIQTFNQLNSFDGMANLVRGQFSTAFKSKNAFNFIVKQKGKMHRLNKKRRRGGILKTTGVRYETRKNEITSSI